jgi:hypothetical protein
MKKSFAFKALTLAAIATLGLSSMAAAQVVNETFQNSSTVVGAALQTTPSSIAGNDYTLYGATTTAAGFEIFTPSVDGGNGLRLTNENSLLGHTSEFTGFTSDASFQWVALIRFENPPAVASVRNEIVGLFLGDAPGPCMMLGSGTDATSAAILIVARASSNTTENGTSTGITGITPGDWTGVVIQYDPPTTVAGADGGFHCWLDPATSAEAPFFSRGTGVTGGSGVTALGLSFARPTNGNVAPGILGYGGSFFGSTASTTPTNSIDDIAIWDGPADLTGGDATLLQNAIDYLAAARLAKVDNWLLQ